MLIFYTVGITENLKVINEKISRSVARAGRNHQVVQLVAVTKTIGCQEIIRAVESGVLILGENRVQEAQKKIKELGNAYYLSDIGDGVVKERVEWHLIGSLQKNKVKKAVQLFNVIHTIDSVELADEVNKHADKAHKAQRVLVQVKLSDEASKRGVLERDVPKLVQEVSKMQNLRLAGLMMMPPFFDESEQARPYFRRLREIRDRISEKGINLPELSMGMSHDFEIAIEEGATMVRIGTAIFGDRKL